MLQIWSLGKIPDCALSVHVSTFCCPIAKNLAIRTVAARNSGGILEKCQAHHGLFATTTIDLAP
jgi:hypothetical protein